jgi:hypothetical protein
MQPTIQVGTRAELTGDFWFRQIRIRTWRATVRQLTWLDQPQQLTETGEYCTWPSRDPPLSQGVTAGMEITGKMHQVEVTEKSLFYYSLITWCSSRPHTHPARCHDTTKRVVDNVFLSFFNHALPEFKVGSVSPDCRVEADWLKCATPQT